MPEARSSAVAAPWQTTTVPATPSRAAARGGASLGARPPARRVRAFDALEQHVAGEAVGHHHVGALAEHHVVTLDEADVTGAGG